jgi:hypothetical protein
MKKKYYFSLLFIISAIIFSFSKKQPIGKWDDIIKLSVKNVEFGAENDSVTITTEDEWWWVTHVRVNDEIFYVPDSINTESDHYSISQDCYVVERRDKHTLFIKADANTTGSQRTIKVALEAGDYFDGVVVTQAGE